MADVVIIGGGTAGMTTALKLSQAGTNVTVVEARARLGGRTWSEALANGEIAERGGEYFDSSMTDVYELTEELGLSMTTQGFNPTVRPTTDPNGPSLEDLARIGQEVHDYWLGLGEVGLDVSMQDIVDGSGIDPEFIPVLSARMACHRSNVISEISAFWSEGPETTLVETEHHTRISGGNQQLSERMADKIGRENVKLRWPVASVTKKGARYVITNMRGETIETDAVVIAVPVSILKDLEVEGLDLRTRTAIQKIGFGDAAKLHLTVESELAPGIKQDVERPYSTWANAAVGQKNARFITGFTATHETQKKLNIAEGPHTYRPILEANWPGVKFGTEALYTYWGNDPWTKGAYSFRPVGWTHEDDEFISAPNGRIFFAGEHTADIHRSLMCGAVRSGKRAAAEVLATIGE